MLLQGKELTLPFPDQILKALFVAPARICCDDRITQNQCVRYLQAQRASVHTECCGKMCTGREPADIYRQSGMCIPLSFHRIRQSMQRPQTKRLQLSHRADRVAQDFCFKAHLPKGASNGLTLPWRESPIRTAWADNDACFCTHVLQSLDTEAKEIVGIAHADILDDFLEILLGGKVLAAFDHLAEVVAEHTAVEFLVPLSQKPAARMAQASIFVPSSG